VALVAACSGPDAELEAAPPGGPLPLTPARLGISPTLVPALGMAEQALVHMVNTTRLADSLKELAARPHHAGSAADLLTAQYVHKQFILAGLESRIDEYEVLLPRPLEITVELLTPYAYRCSLTEEPLNQDFDTHTSAALMPHLAYSPDGDVLGRLVYVNQARKEDFRHLADLGVPIKGAIGIARYGGLFRGSKVKNAAQAGCAALLIYSDPKDDGFVRGDVYPEGPWRPASAVQRGSILDIAQRPGDPLTPGVPAFREAHRIDIESATTLPTIPAAALSAKDAHPLLESLRGPNVPEGWQGALPFPYHLGGTERVKLRVKVQFDWSVRKVWNVVATLRGYLFPNDEILVGNHRDAWVHGAVDPGSGTAVMLEAARVLGQLARDGQRPSRSITFCSFDAEEYGMLGSVEYLEHHHDRLMKNAVAYVNVDAAVSGSKLNVRGSPELSLLVAGALDAVMDDRVDHLATLLDSEGRANLEPPGGGSDFVPFLHQLALPVVDLSSSGPYGVYHSRYDTYGWMKRYGDPGFKSHARVTRLLAVLLNRAACATVLPFDYTALADWISQKSATLPASILDLDTGPLDEAVAKLRTTGVALDRARAALTASDPDPSRLGALNRTLSGSLRLLLADGLLAERPFYKNVLVATDQRDGYGALALPEVQEAIAANDVTGANAAIARVAAIIHRLANRVASVATAFENQAGESTK